MTRNDFKNLLINSIKNIFAPVPEISVAEWASKNIVLPKGQGTENEFLNPDFDFSPDLPFVLEQIKEPDVRQIVLCFGSQCGKSLCMMIMIGYRKKHHQTNCMWVLPVESLLDRFVKERLVKIFEKSDVNFKNNKKSVSKRKMVFKGSYLAVGLASSEATLSSDPMPDIVIDEEDLNPEFTGGTTSPEKLAGDRQRNFPTTSKLIRGCTPKYLDRGSFNAYQKSKRFELRYPCPKCKKYFRLNFTDIKWPKGKDGHSINSDKIESDHLAHYQTPCCKRKIYDHSRYQFLKKGKWNLTHYQHTSSFLRLMLQPCIMYILLLHKL